MTEVIDFTYAADTVLQMAGHIQEQYVRCGKPTCRCAQGSLHGPYFYRTWRDGSRTRKVYVKNNEVEVVRAACEEHARLRQQLREIRLHRRRVMRQLKHAWKTARHCKALLEKN